MNEILNTKDINVIGEFFIETWG
ncbi:(dimethylallyl)adenosine tRNA methylthiotransferase [Clostridium botulinum Af84]|nr:(dimethylallyl)adenosine tRNA methylthiotransferase [Clostridium botulinum Af84]